MVQLFLFHSGILLLQIYVTDIELMGQYLRHCRNMFMLRIFCPVADGSGGQEGRCPFCPPRVIVTGGALSISLCPFTEIFFLHAGKKFSEILLHSMTRFILCRLFASKKWLCALNGFTDSLYFLLFLSGRTEARGGGARSSLSAPSAPFLLPPFRFALVSVLVDGRKGKSKVFNLALGI